MQKNWPPTKDKIAVLATDPALAAAATQLAQRLGLPLADPAKPPPPFLLQLTPERLQLCQTGPGTPGPVCVDLASPGLSHRRKRGGGRRQSLARAVGIKGRQAPTVIDATAGLGRDAFIMADLGCQVRLIERSPLIHALLADGLRRAQADPGLAAWVGRRLQLSLGEAGAILAGLTVPAADVIYLDPMFPERSKSSLVKKELRLLRQLAGDDDDADLLLEQALAKAGERVVVKRPRLAPFLAGRPPSFSLKGKSSRFDIYLISKQP